MEKVVITIARQYGSGGRTVGKMLAKDLGIPYYDKELLKKASEESGINEGLFAGADETLKNSPLLRITKKVYQGQLIPPDSSDFTSAENLFNYQAKVIKQLAEEESCVIIGRCADYVLKDGFDTFNVFVHATDKFRCERICEHDKLTEDEALSVIRQKDKARRRHYKYYTERVWGDSVNYDLCINTAVSGIDLAAEIIAKLAKN